MARYKNSRKILEKKLGRKLKPSEECHHKDGNPDNDDPQNLEALTIHEHNLVEFKGRNALYKFRNKK